MSDSRPGKSAFISHSTPDDFFAAELESLLRAMGYDDVFNDGRSILPDAEFWPVIEAGIRRCDAIVVVITRASIASKWVGQEVEFARGLKKPVIPLWIEDCEIPAVFAARDVIDFRPGNRIKDRKIATPRILRHAPPILFGRDKELAALDAAWNEKHLNLYTLVAWGGVGKTSLVAHWISERFMKRGWPGVERYFDWSFYSQGTGESRQTSADLFINQALIFFGDPDPTVGGPWERGERLAGLIRKHRTLLVLDGIEPLQYPPNDKAGMAGRLKDPGLEALVQSLAADNPGLCLITTREHLKNVEAVATSAEEKLDQLLKDAAVALLRHLQIAGSDEELEAAWKDAGGHALTLQLLGRFIADAYPHDRDIRHYKQVKFAEADQERQGRSAFKVMIAYEQWFKSAGAAQERELAILRLTGLFDRPITADCLQALRSEPAIPGLTDALVKLKETQWNIALKRLIDIDLLSRSGSGADSAIDAHPLVREYFAEQLQKEAPDAFRAAHSRLFDHLCETTPHRPDTLEGLGPLYQAVVHGCLAGRHGHACANVYEERIQRGSEEYSTKKLGAVGSDLAAVTCFFQEPWYRIDPALAVETHPWLLNEAGYALRALGRLAESLQPFKAALEIRVNQMDWANAATVARNVSESEVALGRLVDAVGRGQQAVHHADRSSNPTRQIAARCTAADALHQSGQHDEAGALLTEAEGIWTRTWPQFAKMMSLFGFYYCDWLLAVCEQKAWNARFGGASAAPEMRGDKPGHLATYLEEVAHRAHASLAWATSKNYLLDIALDHLSLARAQLYRALLAADPKSAVGDLQSAIPQALAKLRAANTLDQLPKALLTAAFYYGTLGEQLAEARRLLQEAQQIAERGPMPLYLADVHLHRARLFRDKAELAKARALIDKHGYGRRKEELADAEEAAKGW